MHTPTPYKLVTPTKMVKADEPSLTVARFEIPSDADYALQACNSYDAMKEACERTLEGLKEMTTAEFGIGADKPLRELLAKALALAEGKETP